MGFLLCMDFKIHLSLDIHRALNKHRAITRKVRKIYRDCFLVLSIVILQS